MDIFTLISEPLAYQFMQRAMLSALLVGLLCGVIGSFVVVRGMSFLGDALAHSVLPGVAGAYLIAGGAGISVFAGGLLMAILTALLIGWLTRDKRMKEDTAIGIVFAALFALGIAMISRTNTSVDLSHILFGNILGVRNQDLILTAISAVVVIGIVVLLYKELMIVSFDQSLASALKLPRESLRMLLLVLIGVTIIASLQMVGVVLMLAMMIIPAATAQMFSTRLHHMMIRAAAIGMVTSIIGVYLSYYADIPAGPAIVLVMTSLFLVVFVARHGWPNFLRRVALREQGSDTRREPGQVV